MKGSEWEDLTKRFYRTVGRDFPFSPPAALWYQEWWIGYGNLGCPQDHHYVGNITNYQEGVLDGMASDNVKKWRMYECIS